MGLFDFAKEMGRKVFDTDGEAADNIKEHLEVKMSGIEDLKVDFDDGVATLSGKVKSAADKDLAVLIAGNIKGVKKVNADGLVAPKPTPAEVQNVTFHVVERGDTLGAISKKYLGKSSLYMKVFEANRGLLSDPDKIYPGQKIRIPLNEKVS